ncbi:MAG: hypothetical protein O7G85_16470 [Planctomycetota bacterium]|nr:hypothetical protein [Planctomycetota bacterium]
MTTRYRTKHEPGHTCDVVMFPDRPHHDPFPLQAARVLELIETLESQYGDVIDASDADLKKSMRLCATALHAYLEKMVVHTEETISAIT